MRPPVIAWTGLLLLAAVTAAPAQRLQPPFGSKVQLYVADTARVSGELLAIGWDSIWVLRRQQLVSVPVRGVSQVRVDRGGLGSRGALVWSLLFGVVSGVALHSACSSVDGNCGGVFPVTLGLWGLIGLTSAASLQDARFQAVPADPDSLRARARFPQGLPPGLPRDSLIRSATDH